MKVESIESILQYLWPALSDNQSWKLFFVFFLSGRLRQVLLYVVFKVPPTAKVKIETGPQLSLIRQTGETWDPTFHPKFTKRVVYPLQHTPPFYNILRNLSVNRYNGIKQYFLTVSVFIQKSILFL